MAKLQSSMSIMFAAISVLASSVAPTTNASPGTEVNNERPFTYVEGKGSGPHMWGQVNPEWRVCQTGKLQSPIDLHNERVHVNSVPGELKRRYKPAPAQIRNRGHDIMVEWTGDAGALKINGSEFKLQQCHWHSPSEHTVNGKRYNMELHMVHQNAQKENAVVGILYTLGSPDPFLQKLLDKIKALGEGDKPIELGVINPWEIKFGSRKYYRYVGSLTVPPCTEGVVWSILKKVRTVSREQVGALREAVHDGFENNARPTQEQHDRPLFLYNGRNQQ